MDLYEAMRTTFAARDYVDAPLDDALLYRILENARFAPSGGNRQAWRVIVVRDPDTRRTLAELSRPIAARYVAQRNAGEAPFNTIHPSRVDEATVAATEPPPELFEPLLNAAAVLIICADLSLVASVDAGLDRISLASGASIYPFCWNILLAARAEGYGGVITTLATGAEPQLRDLFGLPPEIAIAAVMPLGKPRRQLTRLRRNPVESFTTRETWQGPPLRTPGD